ncbi:PEP-CTERM sorting domain-containing protein [Luteolibacter pohnpeiensis]|uniref:PEP-CTERM sorting domain-containing protein n=1 Tax=Luteolibacter pohnpeiensis TaxID=454153 RepID=A0A934VSZ6_9BACT|nr:PEP-CTERM sorting domain-containing protein [Luteolibacter pohnpeiensis]MBK1880957.1 PEP-CTERM sorting domain-containing protein [Luteolibacter pohnpeiensis]
MKQIYRQLALSLCLGAASMASTTLNGVTLEPISGLSSDSSYASWNDLSSSTITTTGGFPGNSIWSPINSQNNQNDPSTQLTKISNGAEGGAFVASSSIYFGGFSSSSNLFGGTLSLSTSDPIVGLQTILFQIQIGEAYGYDFYNHELPLLSYTLSGDSTIYTIVASGSSLYDQFDAGTFSTPDGDEVLYTNTYALWFDLSGIVGDIDRFDITWSAVQHAQIYGISIQQDDTTVDASILPAAVPEPAISLLSAIGLAGLIRRRR